MSRDEIKTAITQLLDHSSEEVLNEILEYLKSTEDKSARTISLSTNLRTILSEDKELLERLAR